MCKKIRIAILGMVALFLSVSYASAETIRVTLQLSETHPLGQNLTA